MRKINWKPIGEFVGQACELALYGVALVASYKVGDYIVKGNETTIARYSDAVEAIMKSAMFSHDKSDAVEALKRHETSEYYRAIVQIVKDSSMFSHDKVKMIKHFSKD